MVKDFDLALEKILETYAEQNVKIDLLVLPKIAFDRFGDDLMLNNYSKLSEKYNLPIWLA
ncbi:MAG: hypothetical protein ABIA04_01980 [Pseudomonadota bacterium]